MHSYVKEKVYCVERRNYYKYKYNKKEKKALNGKTEKIRKKKYTHTVSERERK